MTRGSRSEPSACFLGAYTTFSAFAYETQELIREGQIALAAGNAVGSTSSCSPDDPTSGNLRVDRRRR